MQISTLAALAYHKSTGREAAHPNQRLGFAENFLYMLDSNGNPAYRPNPRLARALEIMFILHQVHCKSSETKVLGQRVPIDVNVPNPASCLAQGDTGAAVDAEFGQQLETGQCWPVCMWYSLCCTVCEVFLGVCGLAGLWQD